MAETSVIVSVEGADEIDRNLARVSIELRGRLLQRALRRAAAHGRKETRRRAPKGDGVGGDSDFPDLKKSVKSKVLPAKGETVVAIVGTAPAARQAHMVEFGHKMVVGGTISSGDPARVRPATDPKRTGKGRVIGSVQPHPFVRPSFDAAAPAIERILIDELAKLVDRFAG